MSAAANSNLLEHIEQASLETQLEFLDLVGEVARERLRKEVRLLRYPHSASTHKKFLERLDSPGFEAIFQLAHFAEYHRVGDFDVFRSGVLVLAARARLDGLVREAGSVFKRPAARFVKDTEQADLLAQGV